MDNTELQNDTFTSETVGLLILNELRLMRRDLKAGLMRIETKVDSILAKKTNSKQELSRPQLLPEDEVDVNLSYDSAPIYINKSQLDGTTNDSSNVDISMNNEEMCKELALVDGESPVACTVHVDVNDLPDDVSLDSYDGNEEKPAYNKKQLIKARKNKLIVKNALNGTENIFPIVETEDGRFQCTLCPQSFSNKGNLRRHYRYHTDDKRYKCHVCSKKFFRKDYLYSHYRTHSSYRKKEESGNYEINKDLNLEKMHACDICNRAFSVATNLKRHMRVHTGERPYACSQCDEKFTRDDTLKRHIQKSHPEQEEKE